MLLDNPVFMNNNISSLAGLIWSVADLLRGDFKQSQYGRIILPFTVLRRLECVLQPGKDAVLKAAGQYSLLPDEARHKLLLKAAGQTFYNTSLLDLSHLGETQTDDNLDRYVRGFSAEAREIFEYFSFESTINKHRRCGSAV